MNSKSTTGNFVVYGPKSASTAAPKNVAASSTAQKATFTSVNGYSSYMSCTTAVPKNSF